MAFPLRKRPADQPAEAADAESTAADLAAGVRVPAALQLALRRWRDLQRRHATLSTELRELCAVPAEPGREHFRDGTITRIDRDLASLADEVRTALAEIEGARVPHAASVADALAPAQRRAVDTALSGIEILAGALGRLNEIDRELSRHGAQPIGWRMVQPNLAPLRRRLVALAGQ